MPGEWGDQEEGSPLGGTLPTDQGEVMSSDEEELELDIFKEQRILPNEYTHDPLAYLMDVCQASQEDRVILDLEHSLRTTAICEGTREEEEDSSSESDEHAEDGIGPWNETLESQVPHEDTRAWEHWGRVMVSLVRTLQTHHK